VAPFRQYGRFAALFGAAISTGIASTQAREARLVASAWAPALSGGRHLLIGSGRASAATDAALLNGATIHAADYDDTHQAAVVHPSGAVLPAVLAAAELKDASLGDAVTAYACGLETLIRLAVLTPGEYHRHGFHATGVCGAVGAAVRVAVIEGASHDVARRAAQIAAIHGGGTFEYVKSGGNAKVVYPGLAARWGIEAVRMADAGFEPPAHALDGVFGLVAAHTGSRAELVDIVMPPDLAQADLVSAATAIKSYPCCYFSQVYLDATQEAAGRWATRPGPDEVSEVICEGPAETIEVLFEPRAERIRPTDPYDAKFALPFQIAALVVDGTVSMSTFRADKLNDARITRLAERVVGIATDDLGRYPEQMPARVTMRRSDGSTQRIALPAAVGATRWDVDSSFISARLERDMGPWGEELLATLRRPEWPISRLCTLIERIASDRARVAVSPAASR
jgi:2-methylcitrate dehydratase PrpD